MRAIAVILIVGALIALGVAWAAPSADALRASADRLAHVEPGWLALAAVLALAPALVEALRIRVAARKVGISVDAATALDAAAANAFFTSVTPVTGLGEPTVAWILARRGAPTDAALVVPFVKFTTSFTFIFALGALAFALGLGPPGRWLGLGGALIMGTTAAIMAAIVIAARRPTTAIATIARAFAWLRRRRRLRGPRIHGVLARAEDGITAAITRLATVRGRGFGALLASHALYYAVYVAPIAVLCEALVPGAGLAAMPRAFTYICVTFLAPTPAGAGVAEGSAALFFGDLVGAADAVVVVLAFRAGRFVGQVVAPGLYLLGRGLLGALRARVP
ncbi:MAG: flippase-like domain-containing protein [Deltaproteobacteria bacterium]|nr:flippase-like domain-containing protein [Deltaproteobacteria bacterium]